MFIYYITLFEIMKTCLCVIFFIGLAGKQVSSNYWPRQEHVDNVDSEHYVDNTQEQHVQDHQIDHLDNIDSDNESDHAERPCCNNELKCIRSFLVHSWKCHPVYGPAPDPYIIKRAPMDIPHANLTMTLNDGQVYGLNSGKIKEFYLNRKTDTLVLEVEFEKLVINSPKTLVTYHRKGKEPIKALDSTLIEFRNLSLTLTTSIKNMNLDNIYVYAYIAHRKPLLQVGSGLLRASEKDQSAMDLTWMHNIELSVQEAMIEVGPIYMAMFINSKICDLRHNSVENQSL